MNCAKTKRVASHELKSTRINVVTGTETTNEKPRMITCAILMLNFLATTSGLPGQSVSRYHAQVMVPMKLTLTGNH
jgi:hypothetical protein